MQKKKHCVFSLTCEFFIDTENPFWHESQWGNEQEGEDEATKERMWVGKYAQSPWYTWRELCIWNITLCKWIHINEFEKRPTSFTFSKEVKFAHEQPKEEVFDLETRAEQYILMRSQRH